MPPLKTVGDRTHCQIACASYTNHLSFYFSGIYHEPNCSSDTVTHGVLVVGYGFKGIETDGNHYWLIKNRYKLPKLYI
jgi:hypothetical protein